MVLWESSVRVVFLPWQLFWQVRAEMYSQQTAKLQQICSNLPARLPGNEVPVEPAMPRFAFSAHAFISSVVLLHLSRSDANGYFEQLH